MDREKLVETLHHSQWDEPLPGKGGVEYAHLEQQVDAILQSITDQGFVVLPAAPTEEMIRALDKGLHERWPNARAMAIAAWELMVAAHTEAIR